MRRREKGGFVYLYMEAMVTCARHHFISFPRFFFSFWVWASSFLLCPRGTFAIASPLCVASLCMPRGTFCLCTNPKARIYMNMYVYVYVYMSHEALLFHVLSILVYLVNQSVTHHQHENTKLAGIELLTCEKCFCGCVNLEARVWYKN